MLRDAEHKRVSSALDRRSHVFRARVSFDGIRNDRRFPGQLFIQVLQPGKGEVGYAGNGIDIPQALAQDCAANPYLWKSKIFRDVVRIEIMERDNRRTLECP